MERMGPLRSGLIHKAMIWGTSEDITAFTVQIFDTLYVGQWAKPYIEAISVLTAAQSAARVYSPQIKVSVKRLSLFTLAVASMIIGATSSRAEEKSKWLECAFNGTELGQPNAYVYVDTSKSDEKSMSLVYRSASSLVEPRPLEATGFASADSIYAISVEKVFKIELKRSLAVNGPYNSAELLVNSRTPDLTDWSAPIRYKGTCISVSQIKTPTQRFNKPPTGSLAISGTPSQDQTLSVSSSIADPDGLGPLSFTWQRSANGTDNWITIPSANTQTYTLTGGDVGFYLRSKASYSDAKGNNESITSLPTTSPVTAAPAATPEKPTAPAADNKPTN